MGLGFREVYGDHSHASKWSSEWSYSIRWL
jgi:hypothetical protein